MSVRLRESCYFVRWGFHLSRFFLVLLEEILSLEGRSSASRMCTLVTTHGPIGLGSGRRERMPITHTSADLFRGRRITGCWAFGSHRGSLIRGLDGQHLRLGWSAPEGRVRGRRRVGR